MMLQRTGRSLPNQAVLFGRNSGHAQLFGAPALSNPSKVRENSQHPPVVLRLGPQVELEENTPYMGLYGALP